jgi:hypothetical protein
MFQSFEDVDEPLQGRMSPFAKEKLYRLYIKGTSIKDLSLKFGCLPQRVKAIVYQKHLYWEEVYPRLGETHMRVAIETEALYAAEYPFVDYGCDLAIMSQMEAGVQLEKFHRTEVDTKLDGLRLKEIDEYLSNVKAIRWTKVPETFSGRGPKGYILYDWVHHRRSGSAKPSQKFQNLVRWEGTKKEHYSRKQLKERIKIGGVRWAMQADKKM